LEEISNEKKSRKNKVIAAILISVSVFVIAGALASKLLRKDPSISTGKTTASSKTKAPALYESKLDGVKYSSKELAERHPLAVSIENHPDARPQSGLGSASIVYEAITEGGITRFLAIFSPKDVKEVGPIRSARLFFMDWVKEYDAFFAHDGGNEDALANMTKYGIKDLQRNTANYWKDAKGKNVATEHTLYSSIEKLYGYAKSKNLDTTTSSFTPMTFKDDQPTSEVSKSVEIDFSQNQSYLVKWIYDVSKNQYSRFLAGKEHTDRNSGEQITAKNIIIQTVSRTLDPTGSYGSQNWVFKTTGSGKAVIMQDGKTTNATWKKGSLEDRTKFYDEAGSEIKFNRGASWYEIIPPEVQPAFF